MPYRDIDTARARGLERHRRRIAERAELGLCRRCGTRPAASGRTTCEPCAEKRRAADRTRAEKRRQAGIKRVRDPEARKAEYRRARQRAENRLARGICSKCGRRPNEPNRRLCISCGQKRRAVERERYARARSEGLKYGGRDPAAKRANARKRSRDRQRVRRESSLCIRCGKSPPVKAGSSCKTCLNKRSASDRATYSARRSAGLCTRCAIPTFEGAPVCGPCTVLEDRYRETKNEAARRRYADRRAAWICTHCASRPSFGASRCQACAKKAWERSEQVKGMPVYPPSFTVVERATGTGHGTWDSWEEVAIALSFARLSLEDVDVLIDHAPMHTTFID